MEAGTFNGQERRGMAADQHVPDIVTMEVMAMREGLVFTNSRGFHLIDAE